MTRIIQVALVVPGKFHTFDLARELEERGALSQIFTSYPRYKLQSEGIPQQKIACFPYLHAPYMAFQKRDVLGETLLRKWEKYRRTSLDWYASSHIESCDVVVGLSGVGLLTGQKVQRFGGIYVCDRGSTHISHQKEILDEEYSMWNQTRPMIDAWTIERELTEYSTAQAITVPSNFVRRTFIERGIAKDKIKVLPYGVSTTRFFPTLERDQKKFEIVFVGNTSVRKGIPYLLQAFKKFSHPHKQLTLIGGGGDTLLTHMQSLGLWDANIRVLGHMEQTRLKDYLSAADAMVLPSIEEGLAVVQAQALACGCPVIATENTGCEDLFDHGIEGFIVRQRDPNAIVDYLDLLASEPATAQRMRAAALKRVAKIGGWTAYGQAAYDLYRSLAANVATLH